MSAQALDLSPDETFTQDKGTHTRLFFSFMYFSNNLTTKILEISGKKNSVSVQIHSTFLKGNIVSEFLPHKDANNSTKNILKSFMKPHVFKV